MRPFPDHRLTAVVGILLSAALIWSLFFAWGPRVPPPYSDAWDYYQLGRSLARGEGFQSQFTYPILLAVDQTPPFPTLWRLPLYPLVASLPFLFSDRPPVECLIALSGFFYVLSGVLFHLFLSRVLPLPWAFWGAFVWLLNPHLLDASLQGLSEPFYLCLSIGLFGMLIGKESPHPVGLAILTGLCWLTRSNTLLFLPGLVVWGILNSRTRPTALWRWVVFAATVIVVCLPWWVRNGMTVGDPFFNMSRYLPLMFSEEWPGWTLFRTDFGSMESIPAFRPFDTLSRGVVHLWGFGAIQRLLSCNPLIFLLAIVGWVTAWVWRREDPLFWNFSVFLLVTDLLTVFFLSAVEPAIRLYLPVMPGVILIALWGLRVLWEKTSSGAIRSILALVLGLSVLAYPLRFAAERGKESFEYPPPSEIEKWKVFYPPETLFLSDTPDYLAARLDRPSLFLPTFPSLERSLERWDAPVVLHLSPAYREFLESERESPAKWEDWIESHSQSPDFPIDPRFGNHRFVRIR